jgi:hypothetical protein
MHTAEETSTMETVLKDAMNIIIRGQEEGIQKGFPPADLDYIYRECSRDELMLILSREWSQRYREGVVDAWSRVQRLLEHYKEGKGYTEACKLYDKHGDE